MNNEEIKNGFKGDVSGSLPLSEMTIEELNEAWDYHGNKMNEAWEEVQRRKICNHLFRSVSKGKSKCIKCGNDR